MYLMFAKLLGWLLLRARPNTAKEIEILILVLRHQLAVFQRRTPRVRMSWTDRALTVALTRLLPSRRRVGLVVTPAAILRWHRQLVAWRWTRACPARSTGHPRRPACPGRAPGHREPGVGYRRGELAGLVYQNRRLDGLHRAGIDSSPRRAAPGRPRVSSGERRRTRSWPATCFTSTPSPCVGCRRSSSSSTPPAGCTSSASPPT